jgi:hypothetical protein
MTRGSNESKSPIQNGTHLAARDDLYRSELTYIYNFAGGGRHQRRAGGDGDRLLHEAHGTVAEQHVGAAGVERVRRGGLAGCGARGGIVDGEGDRPLTR